jgi:hypothetical protein
MQKKRRQNHLAWKAALELQRAPSGGQKVRGASGLPHRIMCSESVLKLRRSRSNVECEMLLQNGSAVLLISFEHFQRILR